MLPSAVIHIFISDHHAVQACAALSLCGPAMSVATALEGDLEPFHKLKAFVLKSIVSHQVFLITWLSAD